MKYGEFMAALRKGIPHAMLLAGEEPYYIEKAAHEDYDRLARELMDRIWALKEKEN